MNRTREPKMPGWVRSWIAKGLHCSQEHAGRTVGYCWGGPIRVHKHTHWKPDGTYRCTWGYHIRNGGCGYGYKTPEDCVLRALEAGAMLDAFYKRQPEYDGRHHWPGTWLGSWEASAGVG